LSVCSKYAKAAYAVLRTQRGCPALLGFACDAHAHHFVMSSPFTSSVASAKREAGVESKSECKGMEIILN